MIIVTIDVTSESLEKQTLHWLYLIRDNCPHPILTFVITKIDLLGISEMHLVKTKISDFITFQWKKIFPHLEIPTCFFVSSLNSIKIEELKTHLDGLAKLLSRRTLSPPIFRKYDENLEKLRAKKSSIIMSTKNLAKELEMPQDSENDPLCLAFFDFQSTLGLIIYDKKNDQVCLDPSELSKSIALFLAPSVQFLDGKSGKENLINGTVTINSALHVFKHEKKLVPNGTVQEARSVLFFYQNLGMGKFLDDREKEFYGAPRLAQIFIFYDLLPVSNIAFLPPPSCSMSPTSNKGKQDQMEVKKIYRICCNFDQSDLDEPKCKNGCPEHSYRYLIESDPESNSDMSIVGNYFDVFEPGKDIKFVSNTSATSSDSEKLVIAGKGKTSYHLRTPTPNEKLQQYFRSSSSSQPHHSGPTFPEKKI